MRVSTPGNNAGDRQERAGDEEDEQRGLVLNGKPSPTGSTLDEPLRCRSPNDKIIESESRLAAARGQRWGWGGCGYKRVAQALAGVA